MTKEELRIAVAEARGYKKGYPMWISPDGRLIPKERLPDYPDSMDTCMPLLEEIVADGEAGWSLQSDGEDGYMFILYFDDDKTWQFFSDQMSEAVCRGFLAF